MFLGTVFGFLRNFFLKLFSWGFIAVRYRSGFIALLHVFTSDLSTFTMLGFESKTDRFKDYAFNRSVPVVENLRLQRRVSFPLLLLVSWCRLID